MIKRKCIKPLAIVMQACIMGEDKAGVFMTQETQHTPVDETMETDRSFMTRFDELLTVNKYVLYCDNCPSLTGLEQKYAPTLLANCSPKERGQK